MCETDIMQAARDAGVLPLAHEPVNTDPILEGMANLSLGMIMGQLSHRMRRLQRERKRDLQARTIHENNKWCRKKCPLFKVRGCYRKTYEQQCECERTRGYEREEVVVPEVV